MKTLTKISNTIMEKYLPDPYIFVTILTVLVLLLGVTLTDSSPLDMVTYWEMVFGDCYPLRCKW